MNCGINAQAAETLVSLTLAISQSKVFRARAAGKIEQLERAPPYGNVRRHSDESQNL